MLETELIPSQHPKSPWLMVVLHGLGDSIEGYRWLPPALNLPWLNYLLVNAPDDYYGGFSWYDFEGDAGTGIRRSRTELFQLLDEQRASGFPADRAFIFGFSQGCLMTLEAGLRYPHRFAGLVGISGYAFEPETAVREMSPVAKEQRFLITHGTYDPLLPISQVIPQVKMLQAHGLHIDWHEFAKEHTIAGEAELAVIRKFVSAPHDAADRSASRA